MKKIKHTEASIIKSVNGYFQTGYNYNINNAFIFDGDWESDIFFTNRDGYSFEVEVKISRSDFRADFAKKKHSIFQKGGYHVTRPSWKISKDLKESDWRPVKFMPKRFYYAVPFGLIEKREVPDYAGLIYVDHHMQIVKRAPFIHKNKFDYRKHLCDKFYHRYESMKRDASFIKWENKQLLEKIENLKKLIPQNIG